MFDCRTNTQIEVDSPYECHALQDRESTHPIQPFAFEQTLKSNFEKTQNSNMKFEMMTIVD